MRRTPQQKKEGGLGLRMELLNQPEKAPKRVQKNDAKLAQNVYKTCAKRVQNLRKTCKKRVQNSRETFVKFVIIFFGVSAENFKKR